MQCPKELDTFWGHFLFNSLAELTFQFNCSIAFAHI